MKDLTIIIPCYNCKKTLTEAVESCFHQNLSNFEIVMVDDGSTDGTRDLMIDLATKYPEVKIFFHDKNQGGGATRNTAVSHASSDVIFCLDSDDMLGDGTLAKMLAFLRDKKADGVGVSTSIKFKGSNVDDVAFINNFGRVGEKIQFEDLFETKGASCSLYSVFMHTKKAFEITGGYPTGHGFDTQGFAFRFLANGLTAYTCPDTTYLHRIAFNDSYYIREYQSGKVNHNWLKVYEEFLYLFDDATKQEILSFDFNNSSRALNDFVNHKEPKLSKDSKKWLIPGTRDVRRQQKPSSVYDFYWLGVDALRNGKAKDAVEYLAKVRENGLFLPVVMARYAEALSAISAVIPAEIAEEARKFHSYTLQGRKAPFIKRLWRKIKKILKI